MTARTRLLLAAVVVVLLGIGGVLAIRRRTAPPPAPPPAASIAHALPRPPASVPVADCLRPGPPPVPPDGYTASADDMRLGHDVIQHFVVQLEAYQACRLHQLDTAAPTVSAQQKQAWLDDGNSAVDDANKLAAAFGAALQAFKARTPPVGH